MTPRKIQEMKASGILNIDEINYMNVCAGLMYISSIVQKVKIVIYSLFFANSVKINNPYGEVAIVYSLASKRRSDYDEIVANLSFCLDRHKVNIETNWRFSLTMPVRVLLSIRMVPVFRLISELGVVDGVVLILLSSNYLAHRRSIDRVLGEIQCRIVFTFCDALPIENLFVQVARSRDIATLTLQHGQYAYNDIENNDCANDESYLNFVSHYMCVWGRATYNELLRAGVDKKRIQILGSLRDYSVVGVSAISYADKITTRVFGLVLSADIYRDDNIKMISLANAISRKYGYTYVVRHHPNNNMDLYKNELVLSELDATKNNSLHDYFDKVDFSLMFMTGVFNEAIAYRSRILIFRSGNLLGLYSGLDITISDVDDFGEKYKLIIAETSASKIYDSLHEYFNANNNVCYKYNAQVNKILMDGIVGA